MSKQLVIITGLSGAGITTALKTMEDLNYEVIDNLGLNLIPTALKEYETSEYLCLGIGTRTHKFSFSDLKNLIETLHQNSNRSILLLFLECSSQKLQKRYTTTRRKHPFGENNSLLHSINNEIESLQDVKSIADIVIDTSELTHGDLKQVLEHHFQSNNHNLNVQIYSFSYKKNIPQDADIVFDVRFLQNPFYEDSLKEQTGLDKNVADFLEKQKAYQTFKLQFQNMLNELIPLYKREGKSYLTIAFGCTGGQHRSVFVAEQFKNWIQNHKKNPVSIVHKELSIKET